MTRRRLVMGLIVALLLCAVGGAGVLVRQLAFAPKTITAYFTTATAIYPGDQVRVAGVKVGSITSIEPEGTQTKMTLDVDRDVPIPAEAQAVIVAQNLVSSRYVQLTPAYISDGPTMANGAVIPVDRTAIPVEWDAVKDQLMRLATDLGPSAQTSTPSVARFIDSAANAMGGNGDKLRQTLAQLSGVGRILADGSGDIVDIVKNLQTFVTALSGSSVQIVQFQDRLATLSSVVNTNRSSLDAALTDLSVAVADVQRFIAGSRDQTAEQIQRLANVTQNLADHKGDIEQVLHVTPSAIGNFYNIYNPDSGASTATFVLNNFSNPVQLICGMIGAVENATGPETSKLCSQYFGPALRGLNFNYLPLLVNPYLGPSARPESIVYSEDRLAPGGEGPKPVPPEIPPSISAYTGLNGDVPPPLGYGQPPAVAPGPSAPVRGPAFPSPALFPGAPVPQAIPPSPAPATLPELLLPAEGPS